MGNILPGQAVGVVLQNNIFDCLFVNFKMAIIPQRHKDHKVIFLVFSVALWEQ